MTVRWTLRGGRDIRDTAELSELITKYETAKVEVEKAEEKLMVAKRELIEFYFCVSDLVPGVKRKSIEFNWTSNEFNQMLNSLRRRLKSYPGHSQED